MPKPELSGRYDRAVLWPALYYGDDGQPVLGNPVEIRVRWNDKRAERTDPKGNTVTVDATVHVGIDIPIDSAMALGRLVDWYGTGSAGRDFQLGDLQMAVKTWSKTQDAKGRHHYREVGLQRRHKHGAG